MPPAAPSDVSSATHRHDEESFKSRRRGLALLTVTLLCAASCGGAAKLPLEAGTGPSPVFPAPEQALFPVLRIAPASGWPAAETNAPPRPEDAQGIKGWVMRLVMKRTGAAVPSANRITLLRDRDGDGVADTRSTFIAGLNSPS